ncbi:putative RTA1 domain protein [Aspergillus lentulus]|uniref:RTA1 domain protein n=1 Tax=Aspergillus lentulus TaxID=293939 RepID=A0ABQ1AMG0_ASPLE|nr:putative RTA1 domain protein [Aspergillus lentulus]GFF73240.1 putative RTA1 domain protein [Aspergillus lentulus]GFF84572.1 putative RTA1 domain protein [Aspergillus lentulus]GFF99494.1 putative RTA1 domain protein [Aspergillus lentulus]
MSTEDSTWKYYRYDPSLPAAILFIILFALSSFLHTHQALRTRTWSFIPFVIGGFCEHSVAMSQHLVEWVGYIGRVLGHYETPNWTLGPYILQSLLLLVAPALFAASIYMILGRIILLTNHPEFAIVKPLWLTRFFVCGDVLSFVVQAAGAGLMVTGVNGGMRLGEDVVTGGLFVQIAFFGLFITTATIFNWRMRHTRTVPKLPWQKHLVIMIIACLLIMARSVFRVVEYIQGNSGYLLRHEVFLYVFDGLLMLMQMVLFNVCHPSKLLSAKPSAQLHNPVQLQRWGVA